MSERKIDTPEWMREAFDRLPQLTYAKRVEREIVIECGWCEQALPERLMHQAWDWHACPSCWAEMSAPSAGELPRGAR